MTIPQIPAPRHPRYPPQRPRVGRQQANRQALQQSAAEVDRLGDAILGPLIRVLGTFRSALARGLAAWLGSGLSKSTRVTPGEYRRLRRALAGAQRALTETEAPLTAGFEQLVPAASRQAISDVKQEISRLSWQTGGQVALPQLDTAFVLAVGLALLTARHRAAAKRYRGRVKDDLRSQFALALAQQETVGQLITRLGKLGKRPGVYSPQVGLDSPGDLGTHLAGGMYWRARYAAERLVRTEVSHTYATQQLEALRAIARTRTLGAPVLYQRWDATNDRRRCPICRALDRLVVPLGDPFPGGYAGPPAHPSCRCVLSAWQPGWGDTPTAPKEPTDDPVPTHSRIRAAADQAITVRQNAAGSLPPPAAVLDPFARTPSGARAHIQATDAKRLASIRSVFQRGQAAVDDTFRRGILLVRRGDNLYEVEDGRHRLLVAQEFPGLLLKVVYTTTE